MGIAAGLGASAGAAQTPTVSGTWRYAGGEAERTRRYEAIDRATEGMGMLRKGPARSRLRDTTEPAPRLVLVDEGARVTLTARDRRVTLATDGTPTRVDHEGGSGTMEARRNQGHLVVTLRGDQGVRTTVYRLSPDGRRLALDVRMTGNQLTEPVVYRVTYVREEGARPPAEQAPPSAG